MTPRGFDKLVEELNHLKTVERPAVIQAIADAREHGDLSENAEYHAARERQSFIEGRVAELESKLSRADVIDISSIQSEHVAFGATVTLRDDETDEVHTYRIVGSDESDVREGLLSITSPLARSLIGKKPDEDIDVPAPGGNKCFVIENVQYV